MPVASGSPVSAANTNTQLLDATADDTALGKISLGNTDPVSGIAVSNVQQNINSINSYTGRPANTSTTVVPAWINNDVGTASDTLKDRADNLTAKFDASTGHKHTGLAGDAPPVSSVDLANVVLRGYVVRGIDITGATGGSTDVSLQFPIAVPSTSPTIKGIVVNAPYNKVILRDDQGDKIVNGSGDEIYGRLTESSGVWTLTYYYDNAGTETAYSFGSATDVQWYYQQLYNPITDAPVYSEYAVTPSENTTSDVVDASETQAGKVLLANAAPAPIAATGDKGVGTRVAKIDHTHEGVHAIFKTGGLNKFGDIELSPGTGIAINVTGNKFEIEATSSAIGYQEVPAGPVNGVNTSFGPLSNTPFSQESVIVFVDGLPVDKSKWSLTGSTIDFDPGEQPITGQEIYVFYISSGVPPTPPVVSGTLKTEFRTITALEAVNKKLTLVSTPASPGDVLVDIIGGTAQEFNVDYTVVADELRWNGYALDGILAQLDKVRIHYIT